MAKRRSFIFAFFIVFCLVMTALDMCWAYKTKDFIFTIISVLQSFTLGCFIELAINYYLD